MLQKYEALLRRGNMSEHSVSAYVYGQVLFGSLSCNRQEKSACI